MERGALKEQRSTLSQRPGQMIAAQRSGVKAVLPQVARALPDGVQKTCRRLFPRCVTWCGAPATATRAMRGTLRSMPWRRSDVKTEAGRCGKMLGQSAAARALIDSKELRERRL